MINDNLETIEIEVDSELLRQVEELIRPMDITMERLLQEFFGWLVHPDTTEVAVTQILKWKEK